LIIVNPFVSEVLPLSMATVPLLTHGAMASLMVYLLISSLQLPILSSAPMPMVVLILIQ
jgi:hypothetical protein